MLELTVLNVAVSSLKSKRLGINQTDIFDQPLSSNLTEKDQAHHSGAGASLSCQRERNLKKISLQSLCLRAASLNSTTLYPSRCQREKLLKAEGALGPISSSSTSLTFLHRELRSWVEYKVTFPAKLTQTLLTSS